MLIPHERLSAEALRGVIDEYILREGTDYGAREMLLDEKRANLRAQIARGELLISYDARSDTCSIVPADPRRR